MNVFTLFTDHVGSAVTTLAKSGALGSAPPDLSRIVVEPPRDASHGDLATNAAMALAKEAGRKPRELAEQIAAELAKRPEVVKAEVAGPGFINLTLDPSVWRQALAYAVAAGSDYGRGDVGAGEAVNVEYVSANPTGPMHVGHCRGAVFGDALANLLAFAGFAVTREYYINDAGAQVEALTRSAFLRYLEARGKIIGEIPEGLYPGDYLKAAGEALAKEHGGGLLIWPDKQRLRELRARRRRKLLRWKRFARWWRLVRQFQRLLSSRSKPRRLRQRAIELMMASIREDLAALNIKHDVFFSERSLIEGDRGDQVGATIEWLRAQGHVYEGRLPPPKGAPSEDWEDREQTLFRATAFGDDVDRPLKKSDGSYTYFASDIAYHKSKFDRGFRNMIDVWGADHGGYVKRMKAAVKAVSGDTAELDVKIVQLVKLSRAGVEVKMSKRSGEFVTLREVVDEVGRDAVRFMMLYRKNDAPLDFDLAKVIEQSKDNPVFYVQYGHARGNSVFRNAVEVVPGLPAESAARAAFLRDAPLARLDDAGEIALMRKIAAYPRLAEASALAHEPHRIAFYLYELASEFHALWSKGSDAPHLRFIIQDDPELTVARLALVQGFVTVLALGLALLGVEAPGEMR